MKHVTYMIQIPDPLWFLMSCRILLASFLPTHSLWKTYKCLQARIRPGPAPFLSSPGRFAMCIYIPSSSMAIIKYNSRPLGKCGQVPQNLTLIPWIFQCQDEYWIEKAKRSFRVCCSSEQRTGSERKGATSGK